MMIEIGTTVIAKKMASDSFYKKVIGTVTNIKGDYVSIEATRVMSKWGNEFENHPGTCMTSAKIEDIAVI